MIEYRISVWLPVNLPKLQRKFTFKRTWKTNQKTKCTSNIILFHYTFSQRFVFMLLSISVWHEDLLDLQGNHDHSQFRLKRAVLLLINSIDKFVNSFLIKNKNSNQCARVVNQLRNKEQNDSQELTNFQVRNFLVILSTSLFNPLFNCRIQSIQFITKSFSRKSVSDSENLFAS